MAKETYITRTILTTDADVFCVNVPTKETFTCHVTLPGVYKDDSAMMKAASAAIDTPEVKAVSIEASEVTKTLRGMTISDFLTHSKVLPPRVAKDAETETAEATEIEG